MVRASRETARSTSTRTESSSTPTAIAFKVSRPTQNGKITSKMGDLSVDRTVIDAKKTAEVKMFMNLDLRADKALQFDPERPDQTSHFATGVTVYDTAGTAHVVTMYFNKTDDGVWTWRCDGQRRGSHRRQAGHRWSSKPTEL